MLVSQILKNKGSGVVTTRPDEVVGTLTRLFRSKRIGAAVVVDGWGKVAGIISERDIVYGIAVYGADALKMRVDELMTTPVLTCKPSDDIKHLMSVMTHRRVRHLTVMENGKLCGIVSIGDVVKPRLEEIDLEVSVLRDYARARIT
jgi:CBS domain-containing protein